MLIPICEISIGAILTRSVVEVEVEATWQRLTDTCTIEMPRNAEFKGQSISQVIQRGDKVTVKLGYDGYAMETAFVGFVRDVSADTPIKIHCEDAMYLLKRMPAKSKTLPNAYASVTIAQLAARLIQGKMPVATDNINVGSYRITEDTVAKELRKLKEKYGVSSWFKDGTLHIGLPYSLTTPAANIPRHAYHFQRNLPEDESDLEFKQVEELQLKGVIIYPNGKQKTIEVGDASGDSRTLHYYNTPEAEVQKLMQAELSRLKAGGLQGTIKAFGFPYANHGEIAEITDDVYKERHGSFFIDKVVTNFGQNGYRRTITIGAKIKQ
jgi:hypothetical protein